MASHEEMLAPILLELLEEEALDAVAERQLATYLAAHWSLSPLNECQEMFDRADWALGLRGSSLLGWFATFPGLPRVVAISRETHLHVQDAYEMLDVHDEVVAQRLGCAPQQVPVAFLATIEAGLAHGDHRQAGLGAINGLFGLETAYDAEGITESSMAAQRQRRLLFEGISSLC